MSLVELRLREWSSADPDTNVQLRGLSLGGSDARAIAATMRRKGQVDVVELAGGLAVRTRSHVGVVELGPLRIRVDPKICGPDFVGLLRYAHGLRSLDVVGSQSDPPLSEQGFLDILLLQLAVEAMEIISHGLHRRYLRHETRPESPRGRVDFRRLAIDGPGKATLPCEEHLRSEDCIHNRALLAGLHLGLGLATDVDVRRRLALPATLLRDRVSAVPLDWRLLETAARQSDRLTVAYSPALHLVALLLEGVGSGQGQRTADTRIPGFLFDMNRFFQALLHRWLTENLVDCEVVGEKRLHGLYAWVPGGNPRGRETPTPRPDFAVLRSHRVVELLDAKYRDLWNQPLPREMLYQLTIYAFSRKEGPKRSVILYPATDPAAREAILAVRDPLSDLPMATVVLRPVLLPHLARLARGPATVARDREREALARVMAFGT